MFFQIKQLILWPNRPSVAPHIHTFELGKVNVISGSSKTGKSSIIPIIDYCLGSSSCNIPIGVIREKCSWFGIKVQLSDRELLLCRKNPGNQKQTGQMLFRMGKTVELPESIDENTIGSTNAINVKKMLNDLAHLTNLELDSENPKNFAGAPSFRDLLAFNFQPQNIIANPNSLFFRSDISRYRNRLKVIFPFALGAQTSEHVAAAWELQILNKNLQRLSQKLKDEQLVTDRWLSEILTFVKRARELNLISSDEPLPSNTKHAVKLLQAVSKIDLSKAHPTAESINTISGEIAQLDKSERDVARALGSRRRRSNELKRLSQNVGNLQETLEVQRDRLSLSSWLSSQVDDNVQCPICGSGLDEANKELFLLKNQLSDIEAQIEELEPSPDLFAKERKRLSQNINELSGRLSEVRLTKRSLTLQSDEAAELFFQAESSASFLGELKQALEVYTASRDESDLQKEIRELETRINKLKENYSPKLIREATVDVLKDIEEKIMNVLPGLNSEYPDRIVRLDIEELALKILRDDDESDYNYLWEIGSGANWLAYHLATSLALQMQLSTIAKSPVSSFIIYDQPSQVYFPRATLQSDDGRDDFDINREDLTAVKEVFKTLSDTVREAKGKLQVIVLDHARSEVWEGLDHVHEAGEWRQGTKLVPDEWPE